MLSFSQGMGYFIDNYQHFFIFEDGVYNKVEFIPIQGAYVGNNYVAYLRNNKRLTVYIDGEKHELSATNPPVFARDNLFAYMIDEQLWLYDGNDLKMIEPWVSDDFVIGDDILAYTNNFDQFKVLYNDSLEVIELWDVKLASAGDNLIAYVDNNGFFKIFAYGDKEIIEDVAPSKFGASKNIVAYIDNLNTFKVWYDGEVTELLYERPPGFFMGEDMVCYMNHQTNQFNVFFKGELTTLLEYKPNYFEIKENVLVFSDANDFLYAFYNGNVIRLAAYTPERILIDNDIVVFKNLDGRLIGMEFGKKKQFSEEIATEFELFNRTIVYKVNRNNWRVYYNDRVVEYN